MTWSLDAIGQAFWHHFGHLAVRWVDDYGIEIRVLDLKGCIACRRLWDTLTPVTIEGREIWPAGRAERYRAFQRQAFIRGDLASVNGAERAQLAQRPALESVAVQRVREFTVRRPAERY